MRFFDLAVFDLFRLTCDGSVFIKELGWEMKNAST